VLVLMQDEMCVMSICDDDDIVSRDFIISVYFNKLKLVKE